MRQRAWLPLTGLALFAIAAIGTVAFVAIAATVLPGHADAFDRRWSLAIHGANSDTLDAVFIALTAIGSGPTLWASIALVSVLAIAKHRWELAVLLAANGALVQLVDIGLKHWFARPRPILFDVIPHPMTWSFPSGHAMSAVQVWGAIAAVMIALFPARRWAIATATVALIAGIGLSRVYLGVHWPTDVLAGFAAGLPFLAVCVRLIHRVTGVHVLARA